MVAEWIARNCGQPGVDVNLDALRDFTLMWAFFEGRLKQMGVVNSSSVGVINLKEALQGQIASNRFALTVGVGVAYDYFSQRYISNGVVNDSFNSLYPRSHQEHEESQKVKNFLENRDRSTEGVARSVSYVVCRVRNNLFHGVKSLSDISTQQDLFRNSVYGMQGILTGLGLTEE